MPSQDNQGRADAVPVRLRAAGAGQQSPPPAGGAGTAGSARLVTWAIFLYVVLIVYASLFPLTGWRWPQEPLWHFLQWRWGVETSRSDLVSNVLAYVPLGILLGMRGKARGRSGLNNVALAALAGWCLSFAVESIQQWLPSRMPSVLDLVTNLGGTCLGACAGLVLTGESDLAQRLRAARAAWCVPGPAVNGGLLALLIWVLSQLSPFVPSLDLGTVKAGLSAIWRMLNQPSRFDLALALIYALNIIGLGLLAQTLTRPERRAWPRFALLVTATLLLKIVVVGRVLAPEALAGLAAALMLLLFLLDLSVRAAAWAAIIAVAAGFTVGELQSMDGPLHPFNWIPFAGEMDRNLNGFASILGGVWPFVALGYLGNLLTPARLRLQAAACGAMLVMAIVGLLEWWQTFIPGRYGDVTAILLALAGWLVPWRWHHAVHQWSRRRSSEPR